MGGKQLRIRGSRLWCRCAWLPDECVWGYVILFCGDGFFGEHLADTADLGSDSFQLFFDVLVAAIDVVDAVDDGFAIRD